MFDDSSLFFVVGNGPSLRTKILDALPDGRWIGMNAAYKYWDKTGKYPYYYSCLDPVVVVQHADAILRLIKEGKISEFFLHEEILKAHPALKDHPNVTLRDSFMTGGGALPVSSLSRHKQTTGVLATRFCIERGHRNLCLLGIDCNYVERLSEAQSGKDYELVIKDNVCRNPNYFFDGYQEKNEKYQIPNPEVHSGNLHLQSFIALRNDINRSDEPVTISVGSRESLLSKFNIFPEFDVTAYLGKRRLDAIAVPLAPHELDEFLERLDYWIDPKLQPSFNHVGDVVLHIFMSCGERPELREKIEAAARRLPWLSLYFTELRVTFLDISPEADYYVKGASLNVFCNKSGPNIFWLMVMAACRDYQFTFLMEADCVPVRPGWLDGLEQAAKDCPPGSWVIGANYHGPTMASENNAFHVNGNALYATGDRNFQDFLAGDFLTSLEWLVTRASNNIAYDVAYTQGIQQYIALLRETGVDLRKYMHKFVHTPLVLNLGGTEELKPHFNAMLAVQDDNDVYLGHGRPFLSLLDTEADNFASYFAEQEEALRELRPYSFTSSPELCKWAFKGFGRVEGLLLANPEAGAKATLQFRVDVANIWGRGAFVVRIKEGPKNRISDIAVFSSRSGKPQASLPFSKSRSGSLLEIRVETKGGADKNVSELIVHFTFAPIRQADNKITVDGLRVLFQPSPKQMLPVQLQAPGPEARKIERRWSAWRETGQQNLSNKFAFLQKGSASVILRRLKLFPKAEFISGRLEMALSGASCAELDLHLDQCAAKGVVLTLETTRGCTAAISLRRESQPEYRCELHLRTGQEEVLRIDAAINHKENCTLIIEQITDSKGIETTTGTLVIKAIDFIEVRNNWDSKSIPLLSDQGYTRVVSVNPDAVSFFGHFLNYEARLGKALAASGLDHIIAGPVDAETAVYNAHPEMVRVFTGRTNTLYASQPGAEVPGLAAFETELDAYLATLKHDDATLLFMYCGSLEIAEVFERLADRYPSCAFAISLYYLSWLDLTSPAIREYWRPRLAKLAAHSRIRLIAPSPELAEDLRDNYGVTPDILPHPTTTFHDDEVHALEAGAGKRTVTEGVTVVFPGNQRGGKGYELTRDTILALLEAKLHGLKLRVRRPPDDSLNKSRRAFFDSIRDRVEIVDSYLDETAFRDLLLSADLVVLPYTADRFANRTSGLLVDSLLLGIPCVVIEKTWLARTVSEYGFGVVSSEDSGALPAAILDAVKQISALKAAALEGRDRYMQANSWSALADFLKAAPPGNGANARPAPAAQIARQPDSIAIKATDMRKRLLIIGNGPSTRILAEAGFDRIPADMDTFGTTAAFRYFERIGWWPTYYALADRKVVFHHRETFVRLLDDPKVTTKRFFLSWKVSDNERLELIPHSSTGSFSLKKALELGYKEIFLIGMEGAYVEEILESRALTEEEISERGFGVLNLSRAESKLRIIERTPTHNPNYFFPGYQQEGDVYSLPQAHTHQANWNSVRDLAQEAGARVINLSPISRIEAFERGDIREVFDFVPENCWDNVQDPVADNERRAGSQYAAGAAEAKTHFASDARTNDHDTGIEKLSAAEMEMTDDSSTPDAQPPLKRRWYGPAGDFVRNHAPGLFPMLQRARRAAWRLAGSAAGWLAALGMLGVLGALGFAALGPWPPEARLMLAGFAAGGALVLALGVSGWRFRGHIRTLSEQNRMLAGEIARVHELSAGREAQIERLAADALAERNKALQAREAEIAEARKTAAAHKTALEKAEKTLAERSKRIAALETGLSEKSSALEEAERTLKAREAKIAEARQAAERSARTLAERDKALQGREAEIAEVRKAAAAHKTALEADLSAKSSALEEAEKKREEAIADQAFQAKMQAMLQLDLDNLRARYEASETQRMKQEALLNKLTPKLGQAAEHLRQLQLTPAEVQPSPLTAQTEKKPARKPAARKKRAKAKSRKGQTG